MKKMDFFIKVNAKPGSKVKSIEWELKHLVVRVTSQPEKGKANKQILMLVKDFFDASSVKLVKGSNSTTKVLKIFQGNYPENYKEFQE